MSLTQIWCVPSFSDLGGILAAGKALAGSVFLGCGILHPAPFSLPMSFLSGSDLLDFPSHLSITLTIPSQVRASLNET